MQLANAPRWFVCFCLLELPFWFFCTLAAAKEFRSVSRSVPKDTAEHYCRIQNVFLSHFTTAMNA